MPAELDETRSHAHASVQQATICSASSPSVVKASSKASRKASTLEHTQAYNKPLSAPQHLRQWQS